MTAAPHIARHEKMVIYCQERGLYLSFDGSRTTSDRTWAWTGTLRQGRNALEAFSAAKGMKIYNSGDER